MQQIIMDNIVNILFGLEIKESHMINKYMGEIKKPWTWLKWEKIRKIDNIKLKEMAIVNKYG